MKSPLKFLAAIFAACFITVAAFAAEASPTGTWKWTQQGRQGAATERSVKLALTDGKLTGTLEGFQMGDNKIPDQEISDASFKDGTIAFSVSREFNGNKFTTKYTGKLEGDKITGTSESPGRDGAVQKREWVATRAK